MEQTAELAGKWLADQLELDADRRDEITYGALVLLQSVVTLAAAVALAFALGVLPETAVALAISGALRRYAGGVHLRTPWRCVVTTALLFAGCGLAAHSASQYLPNVALWLRAALVAMPAAAAFAVILRWAPVAAEARPLKPDHVRRLRRGAVVLGALLALLLPVGAYFGLRLIPAALAGMLLLSLTLTPAGHRLTSVLDATLDRRGGEHP